MKKTCAIEVIAELLLGNLMTSTLGANSYYGLQIFGAMWLVFRGFKDRSRPSRRLQRVREVRVASVSHSESSGGLLGPIFGPFSETCVGIS